MDEEVSISVSLPLDSDGFLRRECPSCEQQFKWFTHGRDDPDAEPIEQYFCPLCGAPSGNDSWWKPEQLEYGTGSVGPELDRHVNDLMREAFKGIKGLSFKSNSDFTLGIATPAPLHEPDDMVIVESPCHPHAPTKVPDATAQPLHCLICGQPFAV